MKINLNSLLPELRLLDEAEDTKLIGALAARALLYADEDAAAHFIQRACHAIKLAHEKSKDPKDFSVEEKQILGSLAVLVKAIAQSLSE